MTRRKKPEPTSAASSPQKEDSRLGARVKRYTQVTGTMAGLAAKLAGEKYLGLKIERETHAAELMQALGNLKGPLMKVGQILATIPEALPEEYARELRHLQSHAPSMGWPFVKRRMKSELGPEWEKQFLSFDHDASAAASLGQVHKAVTPAGETVACKLQYPDMASAIEADLKQLKLLFSLYERYDSAIRTEDIHHELSDRLYEELDYRLEARHGKLYAHMLKDEDGVHVPRVIDDLSTGRLLTSTWLEGGKILDYVDAPLQTRNALAMNMFRAWYVPLYHYGVIHGDPHLGNYSVRKDLAINLLDFGCVRVFPPSFIRGVIELYHALRADNREQAVHAFETWGFKDLSTAHIDTLTLWAKFLYAPVLDDRVRAIGEASGGVYGRETARKVHEQLRAVSKQSGGVRVPREFVFMDRAALGLGSVFLHLKAEINWFQVFNELIADFDEKKLAKRQKETLASFDLLHA
jgi:predicted unusual protein kinase regulating ubiquinone biosynthesis (AarF/ABC1/UbiB family)